MRGSAWTHRHRARRRSHARLGIASSALLAPALTTLAAGIAGCGAGAGLHHHLPSSTSPPTTVIPATEETVTTLGYSVDHRAIRAIVLGNPRALHPTLVVGCIHGNETAGIALAERLAQRPPPRGITLWVVPDLNPDGVAADTRQNAHGVDLNRNFPYGWRAIYRPGDPQYAGPHPLSEPESRLAYRLIVRLAPRLTIWFHQPQALVDSSGGDARVERRFATLTGLPLRRLSRYPGSATTWQDHQFPGTTAFVVELPPGALAPPAVARYASAITTIAP